MLDGQSRRNVLKVMAASFGLAGLAACRRPVDHILPYSHGVEDLIPGQAYYYSTVMSLAGQATGLLVETHDGRPTKIEGNPDHPVSLGAATAMQQASILSLYDPDRSARFFEKRQADGEELEGIRRVFEDAFAGRRVGAAVPERNGEFAVADGDARRGDEEIPKAKWVEYEAISRENNARDRAGVRPDGGRAAAVR